jgi:hypothetical protein
MWKLTPFLEYLSYFEKKNERKLTESPCCLFIGLCLSICLYIPRNFLGLEIALLYVCPILCFLWSPCSIKSRRLVPSQFFFFILN